MKKFEVSQSTNSLSTLPLNLDPVTLFSGSERWIEVHKAPVTLPLDELVVVTAGLWFLIKHHRECLDSVLKVLYKPKQLLVILCSKSSRLHSNNKNNHLTFKTHWFCSFSFCLFISAQAQLNTNKTQKTEAESLIDRQISFLWAEFLPLSEEIYGLIKMDATLFVF